MKRAAAKFLRSQNTPESWAVVRNETMFDAFIDECLGEQAKTVQGPIGDLIGSLIDSFLNDPEKWIKVITTIISLFS